MKKKLNWTTIDFANVIKPLKSKIACNMDKNRYEIDIKIIIVIIVQWHLP